MAKEPKNGRYSESPRNDGGDEAQGDRSVKVDMPTFSDTNWTREHEKRIGPDED
jgi:hypothetical protein